MTVPQKFAVRRRDGRQYKLYGSGGVDKPDIEESRRSEAEHERCDGIEECEHDGIPYKPACYVSVPGRSLERLSVKNGGLDAKNDHAEKSQK